MSNQEYTGPFRVGDTILEEYEVLGVLGSGGHAFVYESRDPYLGTPVAVKVIPNPPGGGSDLVSRGRAEAQVLHRLQHPNVVRVHTARPIGTSMVCIVMEKLEGVSLRHLLMLHKRLTITESLRIIRQMADALGAAHRLNVVHRDIKPENVFVMPPDNQVKVLDFGIAKFVGMGLTTNKMRLHGTPLYMSPEHLQDGTVTVRSDIYQLLTVAFELITGINPCFVDIEHSSFDQVAYTQIMRPTPSLSAVVRDAPETVNYIIQKGTSKDPTQRFASMEEVLSVLDQALKERASTHPHEAKQIRYVDEQTVLDVKAMCERLNAAPPDPVEEPGPTAKAPLPPTASPGSPRKPAPRVAPTVQLSRTNSDRFSTTAERPLERPSPVVPVPAYSPPSGAASLWKPVTWRFVSAAVMLGVAVGMVMSWPKIQLARANDPALDSGVVAPTALATEPPLAAPPPPPVAAASIALPAAASSSSPAPVAPAPKPVAPVAKRPTSTTSSSNSAAMKADLAKMKARAREFEADMNKEAAAKSAKEVAR